MIRIQPIELRDANEFIARHHRHHKPVQGHRFSLSALDGDRICGVAVVGRPVARLAGSPTEVLEVTRLCTDGTRNACSALYSAAARSGREMGYRVIQTYVLESEHGTSLKASGWTRDAEPCGGGQWKHTDDESRLFPTRRTDQPTCKKFRWFKLLSTPAGVGHWTVKGEGNGRVDHC